MPKFKEHTFQATIAIIGVNPYVSVPTPVLEDLFRQAGKDKGPIPIAGTINQQPYKQTLVKFAGEWRLYINTTMLKNSPQRIGEKISLTVRFDRESRSVPLPNALKEALEQHPDAQKIYDQLSASRQLEINRYIAQLKTEATIQKNVQRAIQFLLGKERFIGREHP